MTLTLKDFNRALFLIGELAWAHQLPVSTVMSRKVGKEISRVRMLCYYSLRKMGWSYTAIGEVFERRHTTVMRGVRKINDKGISKEAESWIDSIIERARTQSRNNVSPLCLMQETTTTTRPKV